ncbi:MAG: glycosyltransferase family 9 protein [Bryobacteraceae bacterium]|nr:glycosyltransferase family 9 protein [Bryobacteraceae bacterium]
MESISPARLATALLEDCLAGREPDASRIAQLTRLALDEDEAVALISSRQLFGTLVEGLADRFEPALCDAYARLFAQVIAGALPGMESAALAARYREVRRVRPPAFEPTDVYVLSRVTLGADIAVTSILMDGVRQRFPDARLWFAGPRKAWELFEGSSWSFLEVPYGRTAMLRDRLGAYEPLRSALDRPGVLLIDPDSRLTQLGVLPVCAPQAHHLFESRGFGGETDATLPALAREWVRQTLGVESAEPWFHPKVNHSLPGHKVAAVSFGIGENPAKRVADPFEEQTLRYLLESGWQVLLDTGAPGGEEDRRVRATVARMGSAGQSIALHEGSFASFAAFIAGAGLYVGYDSAGQHVAAALDVPLVSVFGGFSCERMLQRWQPDGLGATRVIAVREQSVEDLIRQMREAIDAVTANARA